tara:strand:- start:3375 stop:3476 length:102 start_codon:yes stop_codon:yes gene_type:complete
MEHEETIALGRLVFGIVAGQSRDTSDTATRLTP